MFTGCVAASMAAGEGASIPETRDSLSRTAAAEPTVF
jgi:hypothetical protein